MIHSPSLNRGITFRIKTPAGWDELRIPPTLEGRPYYWVIRPVATKAERESNQLAGTFGIPGKYKVIFTLAKPGYSLRQPGQHTTESELEGDSNLYIGQTFAQGHVLKVKLHDQEYEVMLVANSQGRLGKLTLDSIVANDFDNARHLSWALVSPTLSYLSASLDIPLHISQVDLTELESHAVSGGFLVDHADVGLYLPAMNAMGEEFRHYASMYREALNSSSANYEFLCLFKIIESIRNRRSRLAREAKANGGQPRSLNERFPIVDQLTGWLDALLPPAVKIEWSRTNLQGTFPSEVFDRSFGKIIDDYLRPIRNRIAHGLLDDGELGSSIDEPLQVDQVESWLPTTKYIVRRMLKTEFPDEYLVGVADLGSHKP